MSSFVKSSLVLYVLVLIAFINDCPAEMCHRLKEVSAGEVHTLALAEDNSLWVCGDNSVYRQCGLGSSVLETYTLQPVLGESGVGFLQNIRTFDAGWKHSLAADWDGTLWSWGYDDFGQLGNGSGQENWNVPGEIVIGDPNSVNGAEKIKFVSAGRSGLHSLVVDENGYVYAFGYNEYGQCGNGESGEYAKEPVPVLVLDDDPNTTDVYLGDIANIIQVDAGVHHSLALDDEGYVWHWGEGSENGNYPCKVKASTEFGGQELTGIIQIASCDHSLAVDSSGHVWQWTDSDSAYMVPGGEMGTAYLENIAEVRAGKRYTTKTDDYSMARTSDGHVLEWVASQDILPRYIEDGEMNTPSGLLEDIISIGLGYFNHKVAVCQNGYGWAWGTANPDGRFGVGDTEEHPEPTRMECAEISDSIYLTKTFEIEGDEPNCVTPFDENDGNYLLYNISCGNPAENPSDPNYYGSVYNVSVVDYLPAEVDFDSATGGGVYNEPNHTVTWTIGELAPGDSYSYTLTTKVNYAAEPLGKIYNFVDMSGDNYHSWTSCSVPVCCWGGDIIYVDADAVYQSGQLGSLTWETGLNTGTCWEDAYTDLQDALARAGQGCGSEIWVAEGTYIPDSNDVNISFDMVEDVGIYGGFSGTETQRDQRDWNIHKSILSGYIFDQRSNKIVTASGYLGDAVLDGFTITYGAIGIYCHDTWDEPNDLHEPIFANCTITNNNDSGMRFYDYADATVSDCEIINNSVGINIYDNCWPVVDNCSIINSNQNGISCTDSHLELYYSEISDNWDNGLFFSGSVADVNSCTISYNGNVAYGTGNGIIGQFSNISITECMIENNIENGILSDMYNDYLVMYNIIRLNGSSGIYCMDNSEIADIYNNWIHHNGFNGITTLDTNEYADVRNNTIVYNTGYGVACDSGRTPTVTNCIVWGNSSGDVYNCSPTYSCFDNGTSGTGNIAVDPNFVYSDPDLYNYHLSENSDCINAGNNNFVEEGETDIDGNVRIYDSIVDMGADEFTCTEILHELDWNANGVIDIGEISILADAWLSHDPNDPIIGDPNYSQPDPNEFTNWDARCDLNNDYAINLVDFGLLAEVWQWQACWRESGGVWQAMMGGDSSISETQIESTAMFLVSVPSVSLLSTPFESEAVEAEPMDAYEILETLDNIWENDIKSSGTISKKDWNDFIESVTESLFSTQ